MLNSRLKIDIRGFSMNIKDALGIDILINSITKTGRERNPKDILIISIFLEQSELIKKLEIEKFEQSSIRRMIYSCSSNMEHYFLEEGRFLFREGDKGDKCYIIISGSVSIFGLKEQETKLCGQEYFNHLIRLKSENRDEEWRKTLKINKNVFPIEATDIDNIKELLFFSKLKVLLSDKHSFKEIDNLCKEYNQDIKKVWRMGANIDKPDDKIKLLKKYLKERTEKYSYLFNQRDVRVVKTLYDEHLTDLKKGAFFGTIALESKNPIRTASVKTNEDTHFGFLKQEIYQEHVMVEKQKMNMKEIFYFIENFFPSINFEIFKGKYFHYFRDCEFYKNQNIFNQNEKLNYVYFIKEGEIELKSHLNLNEMCELIELLTSKTKTVFNNKKLDNDAIKEIKNNPRKFQLKLCIYESKKIIGNEIFFFNIPTFFQAKVTSNFSRLYRVSYKDYIELFREESQTKKHLLIKTLETFDILIKRLIELRDYHLSELRSKTNNSSPQEFLNNKITKIISRKKKSSQLDFKTNFPQPKYQEIKFSLRNIVNVSTQTMKNSAILEINNENQVNLKKEKNSGQSLLMSQSVSNFTLFSVCKEKKDFMNYSGISSDMNLPRLQLKKGMPLNLKTKKFLNMPPNTDRLSRENHSTILLSSQDLIKNKKLLNHISESNLNQQKRKINDFKNIKIQPKLLHFQGNSSKMASKNFKVSFTEDDNNYREEGDIKLFTIRNFTVKKGFFPKKFKKKNLLLEKTN